MVLGFVDIVSTHYVILKQFSELDYDQGLLSYVKKSCGVQSYPNVKFLLTQAEVTYSENGHFHMPR